MSQPVPNRENQPGGRGSSAGRNQAGEPAAKSGGTDSPNMGNSPRLVPKALTERVVHMKAVRRLASYLETTSTIGSIGVRELDSLGVVAAWLMIHEREAAPVDVIVDWSGYSKNWLFKIHSGIRDCKALGLIETLKVSGGSRIAITHKGQRVIELYDKMMEVVRQEFEASREKERARLYAKAMKAA